MDICKILTRQFFQVNSNILLRVKHQKSLVWFPQQLCGNSLMVLLKIERCRPLLNEIGSCLSENVIQKLLKVLGKKVSFWSEPCLYYVPFCEERRTFFLLSLFTCTSGLFLKYFMGKTEKKKGEKKKCIFSSLENMIVLL